jgi:molybdopterin converting factor small subunit
VARAPGENAGIPVTVRYFAAARAAAGAESETITVRPGATVAELVDGLAGRDTRLATVLSRCSYLCDGIAVRGGAATSRRLRAGETIDVLPPFAGG